MALPPPIRAPLLDLVEVAPVGVERISGIISPSEGYCRSSSSNQGFVLRGCLSQP